MRRINHGGSCGDSCCLRIQDLGVRIGGDRILEDVNLHIHCGQMVALIGPNGAGKSTLIKAILGQQEYEGIIAFSAPGMRHRKMPRIGYVPQSPAFDPGDPVTVKDLFACCQSRRPAFLGLSAEMKDKVAECLERVRGDVRRTELLVVDEPLLKVVFAAAVLLQDLRSAADLLCADFVAAHGCGVVVHLCPPCVVVWCCDAVVVLCCGDAVVVRRCGGAARPPLPNVPKGLAPLKPPLPKGESADAPPLASPCQGRWREAPEG